MLNTPANFTLLLLAISAAQEFFASRPTPPLKEVLNWIAGPYALHTSIQEMKIKLVPSKES